MSTACSWYGKDRLHVSSAEGLLVNQFNTMSRHPEKSELDDWQQATTHLHARNSSEVHLSARYDIIVELICLNRKDQNDSQLRTAISSYSLQCPQQLSNLAKPHLVPSMDRCGVTFILPSRFD